MFLKIKNAVINSEAVASVDAQIKDGKYFLIVQYCNTDQTRMIECDSEEERDILFHMLSEKLNAVTIAARTLK